MTKKHGRQKPTITFGPDPEKHTFEPCNCPQQHPDGKCVNPSLESEGMPGWKECGCCAADCPDVHPFTDGSGGIFDTTKDTDA